MSLKNKFNNISGAEYVEVYFGGSKFTIAELLEIVSEQFNVSFNLCFCYQD